MKERIISFLRAENKSSAQFAEEIGVQPSGISHILSGRNKPSLDFIIKMLEKYTFLSTDWLLFGKGQMYKDPKMGDLFDIPLSVDDLGKKRDKLENDDPVPYGKSRTAAEKNESLPQNDDSFRIKKIICLYTDNSFDEYSERKQ